MTRTDALYIFLLLGADTAMVAGLRFAQVRWRMEPELARKMFHVLGGLVGMTLPWLFDSMLPVVVLSRGVSPVHSSHSGASRRYVRAWARFSTP